MLLCPSLAPASSASCRKQAGREPAARGRLAWGIALPLRRAPSVPPKSTQTTIAARRRPRPLLQELSAPLSTYVKRFPNPSRLHPFESALLQLTVSQAAYRCAARAGAQPRLHASRARPPLPLLRRRCSRAAAAPRHAACVLPLLHATLLTRCPRSSALSKVDALRKSVQEVGKAYANRAANASGKQVRPPVAWAECSAGKGVGERPAVERVQATPGLPSLPRREGRCRG